MKKIKEENGERGEQCTETPPDKSHSKGILNIWVLFTERKLGKGREWEFAVESKGLLRFEVKVLVVQGEEWIWVPNIGSSKVVKSKKKR